MKNNWPKAFAVVFGTLAIVAGACLLNNANVMWSMILLYFIINDI